MEKTKRLIDEFEIIKSFLTKLLQISQTEKNQVKVFVTHFYYFDHERKSKNCFNVRVLLFYITGIIRHCWLRSHLCNII